MFKKVKISSFSINVFYLLGSCMVTSEISSHCGKCITKQCGSVDCCLFNAIINGRNHCKQTCKTMYNTNVQTTIQTAPMPQHCMLFQCRLGGRYATVPSDHTEWVECVATQWTQWINISTMSYGRNTEQQSIKIGLKT